MYLAHHVKENKVLQPPGMLLLESFKARAIAIAAFQEILRCALQQRQLDRLYFIKINARGSIRQLFESLFADPAALRQPLQADEQRVCGKS